MSRAHYFQNDLNNKNAYARGLGNQPAKAARAQRIFRKKARDQQTSQNKQAEQTKLDYKA